MTLNELKRRVKAAYLVTAIARGEKPEAHYRRAVLFLGEEDAAALLSNARRGRLKGPQQNRRPSKPKATEPDGRCCLNCGLLLVPREAERRCHFARRKCCDRICAGGYRKANPTPAVTAVRQRWSEGGT